jgi:hypothetical protein
MFRMPDVCQAKDHPDAARRALARQRPIKPLAGGLEALTDGSVQDAVIKLPTGKPS